LLNDVTMKTNPEQNQNAYTIGSIFMIIFSLLFAAMGYILRHLSGFAEECLALGLIGSVIGVFMLVRSRFNSNP
jgi:hypothetical protein